MTTALHRTNAMTTEVTGGPLDIKPNLHHRLSAIH